MNIFVLDRSHEKNVSYYMKSHVTKMPLEYTQLLSTAVRVIDYPNNLDINRHDKRYYYLDDYSFNIYALVDGQLGERVY